MNWRSGIENGALRGAVGIVFGVSVGALLLFAVDPGDVRLASKTGATADIPEPPLRANSGLMHRSKRRA